jgi:hypothetical protein
VENADDVAASVQNAQNRDALFIEKIVGANIREARDRPGSYS